jgi:hypothetical protein
MSTMFNGRTWAVNDAAKPINVEGKGSFAASPLVPSAPVLSRWQLPQNEALDRTDWTRR